MTKIQKLERVRRVYKYLPIVFAIIILGYIITKEICNNVVEIYDSDIENELLKPEIKQQFHLSNEEYVEIFWNDETDEEKFSKEKLHKKYGSKFYAKLISEDEIEIVVKNETGELMDNPKRITNFVYLREHYKTKP